MSKDDKKEVLCDFEFIKDKNPVSVADTSQSVTHLVFADIPFLQMVLLYTVLTGVACGGLAVFFQQSSLPCVL